MMTDEIIHVLSERENQYHHLGKHNHLTVTEQSISIQMTTPVSTQHCNNNLKNNKGKQDNNISRK